MTIAKAQLLDNFVWEAFDQTHGGLRKRRAGGFTDICCPMCVSRGTSRDRKFRCGVKPSATGVGVNCFNCGFKTGWTQGRTLLPDMKEFLRAVGVSETALARIGSMAALLQRHTLEGGLRVAHPPTHFSPVALPPGSRPIDAWAAEGCIDPDFLAVATYMLERGSDVGAWAGYHWTPDATAGMNRRLVIPFQYGTETVGYTARAIDPAVEPRYVSSKRPDFLFNSAVLRKPRRRYAILLEGVFDALALDGVALLGSTVTPRQAAWLKASGQQVIVMPDRDEAGDKLIDAALRHGWSVAFPHVKGMKSWWDADVKDAAEAVRRYGRVWTLLSIIETATADPSVIAVRRRLCR